jgi:hypothetical protein
MYSPVDSERQSYSFLHPVFFISSFLESSLVTGLICRGKTCQELIQIIYSSRAVITQHFWLFYIDSYLYHHAIFTGWYAELASDKSARCVWGTGSQPVPARRQANQHMKVKLATPTPYQNTWLIFEKFTIQILVKYSVLWSRLIMSQSP